MLNLRVLGTGYMFAHVQFYDVLVQCNTCPGCEQSTDDYVHLGPKVSDNFRISCGEGTREHENVLTCPRAQASGLGPDTKCNLKNDVGRISLAVNLPQLLQPASSGCGATKLLAAATISSQGSDLHTS